jgi:hypothetical protein
MRYSVSPERSCLGNFRLSGAFDFVRSRKFPMGMSKIAHLLPILGALSTLAAPAEESAISIDDYYLDWAN